MERKKADTFSRLTKRTAVSVSRIPISNSYKKDKNDSAASKVKNNYTNSVESCARPPRGPKNTSPSTTNEKINRLCNTFSNMYAAGGTKQVPSSARSLREVKNAIEGNRTQKISRLCINGNTSFASSTTNCTFSKKVENAAKHMRELKNTTQSYRNLNMNRLCNKTTTKAVGAMKNNSTKQVESATRSVRGYKNVMENATNQKQNKVGNKESNCVKKVEIRPMQNFTKNTIPTASMCSLPSNIQNALDSAAAGRLNRLRAQRSNIFDAGIMSCKEEMQEVESTTTSPSCLNVYQNSMNKIVRIGVGYSPLKIKNMISDIERSCPVTNTRVEGPANGIGLRRKGVDSKTRIPPGGFSHGIW